MAQRGWLWLGVCPRWLLKWLCCSAVPGRFQLGGLRPQPGWGGGLIALWQVLADGERRLTGPAGQGSWELLAAW